MTRTCITRSLQKTKLLGDMAIAIARKIGNNTVDQDKIKTPITGEKEWQSTHPMWQHSNEQGKVL